MKKDDVNVKGNDGNVPPLHRAVADGDIARVKTLISNGAEPMLMKRILTATHHYIMQHGAET